ncbi:hypothetical protein R6Q59_031201 [Mikania micrantha]
MPNYHLNQKRITPLLRFFSSKSEDELISLDEYIDNMDEKQNAIYYIEVTVAKVQISNRLSSSPCVLVSGKFGWSANMERLMKAQTLGDTSTLEFMRGRRIMEVNPDHPIIKDLNVTNYLCYPTIFFSLNLILEIKFHKMQPDNPAELGGKIYEMMAVALGGKWGRVEESEDSATDSSEPTGETEVVEPSEVRTETDPWST